MDSGRLPSFALLFLFLNKFHIIRRYPFQHANTCFDHIKDLIADVSLYNNLFQPLGILRYGRSSSELWRKLLGSFLQIDSKGFKAVDRCDIFSFIPFNSFDCYLQNHRNIMRYDCRRSKTNFTEIRTCDANFFLRAASALASAFASFLAVSFSSFVCASRLRVPTLAWRASGMRVRDLQGLTIFAWLTHRLNSTCWINQDVLLLAIPYTVLYWIRIHNIQEEKCRLDESWINMTKSLQKSGRKTCAIENIDWWFRFRGWWGSIWLFCSLCWSRRRRGLLFRRHEEWWKMGRLNPNVFPSATSKLSTDSIFHMHPLAIGFLAITHRSIRAYWFIYGVMFLWPVERLTTYYGGHIFHSSFWM